MIDPPYEMPPEQQAAVCAQSGGTVVLWGMAFELVPVCQAWGQWPDLDLVWKFPYGRLYSAARPLCHHRSLWLFGVDYYDKTWRDGERMPSTVFDAAYVSQFHQHQKPLAIVQALLEQYSPPESVVYSPFGGSGTDLIAAHRTGRAARIIELDPRSADVILKRAEAEGLSVAHVHDAAQLNVD
jgi:hypothetical protein